MSLCIVPGTFDPMTLGHLALIKEAAARYGEVVVAVMVNEQKTPLYPTDVRVAIARATVAGLPNVRVISDRGLLIDLFDRLSADAVVKGYRNRVDYDYETKMDEWNRAHNPRFRTVLLRSEPTMEQISSTVVREKIRNGETLDGLVHPDALPLLK